MTRISEAQSMIGEFHRKMDIAPSERLTELSINTDLVNTASRLFGMSNKLLEFYKSTNDSRFLRMHLILEEAGELSQALANLDELGTLDALGDLIYVVTGTATVYHMPLEEAFDEIHKSNMSKERQASDPDGDRVRDKGPNYRAPNLAQYLPLIEESLRHEQREHDSRAAETEAS